MAGEVLVDALPYIDSGYDEAGVKQAALALVEEECKRYKPTKNYLDILGSVDFHAFETELLKNEFERMEQRLPMELLSMKRYELPPPPPNKQTDALAWYECVENSCAQLEHQASRIMNLEIMAEYGSNAWRIYNQTLKVMFDQAEKQIEILKKQIQTTNLSRKTEQTYAGVKLKTLEESWVGLVSKNYEIECAVAELEKELVELKKKKATETSTVVNIGTTDKQIGEENMIHESSENTGSPDQEETKNIDDDTNSNQTDKQNRKENMTHESPEKDESSNNDSSSNGTNSKDVDMQQESIENSK